MTYPLIGNYGRLIDDDQSAHPWLRALVVANATAAVLEDARQLAALLRDAAIPAIAGVDTRALARHLRTHGSLRAIVTEPGVVDRTNAVDRARAVPRWEDQDFVGKVSPSSIMDIGSHDEDGPLIGDRRLRAQVEHRPSHAPAGCPRADPAPHDLQRRRARARHRRAYPLAWTGRSGATRRAGRPGTGDHRGWTAAARDLPGSPDRRACGRRRHDASQIRAPRREPPGPGRGPRARPGHGPEPRGPGRRRLRPRRPPASGSARSTSTTGPSRACATANCRSRPSSTTPRAPPGRWTRSRCSTDSSPPRGGGRVTFPADHSRDIHGVNSLGDGVGVVTVPVVRAAVANVAVAPSPPAEFTG